MQLEDIAQSALERTKAPSLSIAAVRDGEVVFTQAFGDAAAGSVYNIASVTKQFTAACVLLLARDGKLSLGDRVSRWFPNLTRASDITLEHLLSHTSGYPDYYPLSFADEEKLHDMTPSAIVQRYATQELQFEPGSAYSYSNTGYHIAGLIIERVTGAAFEDFLTQRVLRPAALNETFFNDPPRRTPSHVSGCTRYCLGPQRDAAGERAGWMWASGGLASTARDIAAWHTVLMSEKLLTRDELAVMTRPFKLNDGSASVMALGWFAETRGGRRVIQHSGGMSGFVSQTVVSLEERCSVVALTNGDHVPIGAIASELFEELLPGAKPPAPPAPADPYAAQAAARRWIDAFANAGIDDARLTSEFETFLTQGRKADAQAGLREAGDVRSVEAVTSGERGGMAWHRVRVTFDNALGDAVFRETEAGALAEFNLYPALR